MKRTLIPLTAAAALALGLAVGVASAAGGARLALRKTHVGTILVEGRGFTVYAFTRDARNSDSCQRLSGCLKAWPPVTTAGKPIAGHGVKASLIGTIKLSDGARQVTYAGHPLYRYIGDSSPGETGYVNVSAFGGRWPAVNAAGGEVG